MKRSTIWVLACLAGVAVLAVGPLVSRALQERRAVDAILAADRAYINTERGYFGYSFPRDGGRDQWNRWDLLRGFAEPVYQVGLRTDQSVAVFLDHVSGFPGVEVVCLGPDVSEVYVRSMAELLSTRSRPLALLCCDAAVTSPETLGAILQLDLKCLQLENLDIKQPDFSPLASAERLEVLLLAQTDDEAIEQPRDLGDHFDADAFRSIADAPSLTVLSLRGISISDQLAASLAQSQTLEVVELHHCSLGPAALAAISRAAALRHLSLRGIEVSDEMAKKLLSSGSPTRIELAGCEISPAAMAAVLQIPSLSWLTLSEIEITDEMADQLAEAGHLTHLMMSGCSMSQRSVEKIKKSAPHIDSSDEVIVEE